VITSTQRGTASGRLRYIPEYKEQGRRGETSDITKTKVLMGPEEGEQSAASLVGLDVYETHSGLRGQAKKKKKKVS